MKSRVLAVLVMAFTALLTFTTASARVSVSTAIKTGLNLANVRGDDAAGTDIRTGFVTGVSIALNFGDATAFETEILYCMKGTQQQEGNLTTIFKLDYIEVPMLMKLTLSTDNRVDPFLYAGPAVATNVSAKKGYSISGSGSLDNNVDNVKSADLSWVTGGGVIFDLSKTRVSLEIRYDRGFLEFVDDPVPNGTNIEDNGLAPDWKHSDISILLGIYF